MDIEINNTLTIIAPQKGISSHKFTAKILAINTIYDMFK
jgi:hypothetical protein